MARLIFINRFFYPDHSATSQILSDLAFHLANEGHEIHVITSRQIYDDSRAALAGYETVNAVHVHRVASTQFGRSALLGRAFDYLSFYRSVRRSLTELTGPNDLIIAKTDPPLLSVVAGAVARRRGARLVNWLQDNLPGNRRHFGRALDTRSRRQGTGGLAQSSPPPGRSDSRRWRAHGPESPNARGASSACARHSQLVQ